MPIHSDRHKKASTFTGFCNDHDTKIFHPIDIKPLDLCDVEQLFLIAYRSATRELHAAMSGAVKAQSILNKLIAKGRVLENSDSEPMRFATFAFLKAWLLWRFRFDHYDHALNNGNFETITHSKIIISGRSPVIASSAFFPIEDTSLSKKTKWIALNIIPIGASETAVIFSYPKKDSSISRKRIAGVMTSKGEKQLVALSTLVLDSTENFFLRPSHVKGWSDVKKTRIEEAFISTVSKTAYLKPDPDLMLF